MYERSRKEIGYRTLLVLAFILAAFLLITFKSRAPARYPEGELRAAEQYVSQLPANTAVNMFNDNQPTTALIGASELTEQLLTILKEDRQGRYRKAWGTAEINIFVTTDLSSRPAADRQSSIATLFAGSPYMQAALDAVADDTSPCLARRYTRHNWSSGGFLLVGSASGSSASALADCVLKGFDYLDGFPTPDNRFDQQVMPIASTRAVVLDYVQQCAVDDDAAQAQRSNYGLSAQPSLDCVRRRLKQAIEELNA